MRHMCGSVSDLLVTFCIIAQQIIIWRTECAELLSPEGDSRNPGVCKKNDQNPERPGWA